MVRFSLSIAPPLLFFATVILFIADFRLVSIATGLVGCAVYFLAKEISAS